MKKKLKKQIEKKIDKLSEEVIVNLIEDEDESKRLVKKRKGKNINTSDSKYS